MKQLKQLIIVWLKFEQFDMYIKNGFIVIPISGYVPVKQNNQTFKPYTIIGNFADTNIFSDITITFGDDIKLTYKCVIIEPNVSARQQMFMRLDNANKIKVLKYCYPDMEFR